ncbi:MAG TPA: TIGR03086 family metal-binding protein [Micromonosporaceae bacterium]|nr:TIGR03086 family metal-binding protein [Micromonosporaceae bacterium]
MTGQPIELLRRAVDQMSSVIGAAGQDNADRPTPCANWDVRTLAEHVIMDVEQFTVAAAGERPDWSRPRPSVDGDWRQAFDAKAPGLLGQWSKVADFDTPVTLPIGAVPLSFVVKQQMAEFAVHAWDLARATGQQPSWDDEVAGTALAWSRTTLKPEFRGEGKAFGPAWPEPPGAEPTAALVAWFGRDPGWSAAE